MQQAHPTNALPSATAAAPALIVLAARLLRAALAAPWRRASRVLSIGGMVH